MAAGNSDSTMAHREIRELNMDEMSTVSGGYGVVGVYVCPKCQDTNTVYTTTSTGAVLICRNCKKISKIT